MSDERDLTDGPPDPLDAAYREAEARLDDDAARAARRARLLAAVAAEAGASPAPADAAPMRPARRLGGWRTGGWLVAACVAGLGLFVALHSYSPPMQQPAATPVTAPDGATSTTPSGGLVSLAAPPPPASSAPPNAAPVMPNAAPADQQVAKANVPPAGQAPALATSSPPPAAPPAAAPPPPPVSDGQQAERRDELAQARQPRPPMTEAPRAFPTAPPSPPPPPPAPSPLAGRIAPAAPQTGSGYAAAGPSPEAEDAVRGGADHAYNSATTAPPDRGAALRDAAASGRVADVEALLAQGTPVDAADAQGDTALMRAIQSDQPAAAAALRRHGASLDHRNHAGQSARDMTTALGDPALARAVGVDR